MGGIGITHRRDRRKVYVEFYNDGKVHTIFSERSDPPQMNTEPVEATTLSFDRFISKARSYLNG